MSQPELLKRIAGVLEGIGIEYMVTGSLASSLQGEPRSTHDIDLVVQIPHPPDQAIAHLIDAFPPPDFFLDETAAVQAIASHSMFNLLDVFEGDKVDFWVLTDEAFDRSRFERRREEEFEGVRLRVSAPEDTILMKLKWAELSGGSEKQFTDALRVYEVQHGELDQDYLDRWASLLEIEPLYQRLKSEANPV